MFETNSLAIRGLNVVKAHIAIISNAPSLIYDAKYFEGVRHPAILKGNGWHICCQKANFSLEIFNHKIPGNIDGYFYIIDNPIEPTIHITSDRIVALGEWPKLELEVLDDRYTLLGNQGLLFKFILKTLEYRYGIYNLHACALIDESSNELVVALGERGSGKSALLLSALDRGLFKLFASEIVHVSLEDNDVIFYRGATRNNVRIGHLVCDFPRIAEKLGLEFSDIIDIWDTKVQIDLEPYSSKLNRIVNPKVTLIMPRIEEYVKNPRFRVVDNVIRIKRIIFENLSDKIESPTLIYERIPIGGFKDVSLRTRRLEFVERILESLKIKKAISLYASPSTCLEGWT